MKSCAIIFALLSLALGCASGFFWWRSTANSPPTDMIASYIKDQAGFTPMDRWLGRAAENNRIAAVLTGLTAIAGAISSIFGAA